MKEPMGPIETAHRRSPAVDGSEATGSGVDRSTSRRGTTVVSASPALVHDYLVQVGGAERCLEEFAELFPEAPIYTAVLDAARFPSLVADRERRIVTSFLQRVPLPRRLYRSYLPLYPLAFELLDLRGHDLVISSSSAFAKGVLTDPSACHICYCYTPMRFAWDYHSFAAREVGPLARIFLPPLVGGLRVWDRVSADRVDHYVAISRVVAARVRKYYGRESAIIHPPVPTGEFRPWSAEERAAAAREGRDAYLVVSRLAPYKRIDVAVAAFNQLRRPLVVIGDGRDAARLRRMAGPTIRFLGRVSDAEVRSWLAACRALIWPGEEDFGMVPVEALASGRPVVAYGAGGVLEIVEEGVSGVFFTPQVPEALAAAVLRSEQIPWDPERLSRCAARFDTQVFRAAFRDFVAAALGEHRERQSAAPGAPCAVRMTAARTPSGSSTPLPRTAHALPRTASAASTRERARRS
jgi:glycosyltransferase involved in cell wall biosynthesis